MTNKKLISVLTLFIILFIAIGATSAVSDDIVVTDVNTTTTVTTVDNSNLEDSNSLISQLNTDDTVLNDGDSEKLNSNSVPNGDKSFTQLQTDVATGTLSGTYKWQSTTDGSITDGITINTIVIINCDNAIIDGSGHRAFNITSAGNLTITGNLSIKNCNATNGGAFYSNSGTLTVNGNLSIENCNATSGGAFYSNSGTLTVNGNLSIENCNASNGGAFYNMGTLTVVGIVSCTNCNATGSNGGGAFRNAGTGTLNIVSGASVVCTNCTAINGGAFRNSGTLNIVSGASVVCSGCSATNGGAFYSGNDLNIANCTIINCTAGNGSAIYFSDSKYSLTCNNCIFDCTGSNVIYLNKYGSFNLNNNYWAMNNTDDFGNLIYNKLSTSYITPDNWVLMSINGPDKIVKGVNATYTISYKYNNGTAFTGDLPDYTFTLNDENVTITGNSIDYVFVTDESSAGTLVANSITSGNELARIDYVVVPDDSYTVLQGLVNEAILKGETLVLDKNYTYYSDYDSDLKTGVVINGALTIDGNNSVINGLETARAFNIYSTGTLTVNGNLSIENCNAADGGAFFNSGTLTVNGNLSIENCNAADGGAFFNSGTLTVNGNLSIENCTATNGGGAFRNSGTLNIVSGASVVCSGCSATNGGGAFYNSGTLNIVNCAIINCTAGNGSAIYFSGDKKSLTCNNCIFDCTGSNVIYLNKYGSFNLNNNYWAMNCTSVDEFEAANLIYDVPSSGYIAPGNWVLMSVSAPVGGVVVGVNNTFTVALDKLCDGFAVSGFDGVLPDYYFKDVNGDVLVIPSGGNATFGYVPEYGGFKVCASDVLTGNELASFVQVGNVTLNLTVSDIIYGDGVNFTAVVVDNVTGKVISDVSVIYYVYDSDGVLVDESEWDLLDAGDYKVYAYFNGTEVFNSASSGNKTFTVNKGEVSSGSICIANVNVTYGDPITIVVNNLTGINGEALSGNLTVTITVENANGDNEYNFVVTDGEGTFNITDVFNPGTYDINLKFTADNYVAENNTEITINNYTPTVTVYVNNVTVGVLPVISATVIGFDGEVLDNSSDSVRFHIYNATGSEIAEGGWNKLPVGNYTVIAEYFNPAPNYNVANGTGTFNVTGVDMEVFIVGDYECDYGENVTVVVGISKKVVDGTVTLFIGKLDNYIVKSTDLFVKNDADGKYYFNFTVETTGFNEKVIGLNAVLRQNNKYLDSDESFIKINYTSPVISNVYVTGNYSDYVNITFTVVNGSNNDVIILHLIDGNNSTATVNNGNATFENVYLSKATDGTITTQAFYTSENVCLTNATVYWTIGKLDTNITFTPVNVTTNPTVFTSVNISVYDAKGVLVKTGQINITDENIILLNENSTLHDGTIYNLTNGEVTVYFKYNDNGEFTPKFDYLNDGAIWSNNDNYNLSNATLNVTVKQVSTIVNVDNLTYESKAGREFNITGNVTAIDSSIIPKGIVSVNINGTIFNATVGTDGKFSIPVVYNVSGIYTTKVEFVSGNTSIWNNNESADIDVIINALNVFIVSNYEITNAYSVKYNKTRDYVFNVTDEYGNDVVNGTFVLYIKGIGYTTEVVNGKANVSDVTIDDTGLFNCIVDYLGNKYYNFAFNFTNIKVNKIATHIQINGTIKDDNKEINITVLDDENNTVTKGILYFVTPDGQEHSVVVNGNPITLNIAANRTGEYNISTSYYDLDGDFLYSTNDFNYNISIIDMTSTFQISNSLGEPSLEVTFNVNDENGNAVNKGQVEVLVGSKVYTVDVRNGKASLNLNSLGPVMVISTYQCPGEECIQTVDCKVVEADLSSFNSNNELIKALLE